MRNKQQRHTLAQSVIVVTGASSGFGALVARACAAHGAQLVLAARGAAALERLAAELGSDRVLAVPADVTSDADVERLAAATYERFGRADVLVNNAGFGIMDRIADAATADLLAMLDVNVAGAARCTKAFLPGMLAQRSGQIVNVASLAGLVAPLNMGFYSASKFALVGFSRSLMLELYGTGVRCALICPGVADTPFMEQADIRKYPRAALLATTTPEAVAQAVTQAILEQRHGEWALPARGRMLAVLSLLFPGLSRRVSRVVR